jgi:hypothetical protein
MIPHKDGELLGAHFGFNGKAYIALGQGPGNTMFGFDKSTTGAAPILIFPLLPAEQFSKSTRVDPQQLAPRPTI